MGVLSKALQGAVIAALVSGCATGTANQTSETSDLGAVVEATDSNSNALAEASDAEDTVTETTLNDSNAPFYQFAIVASFPALD